MIETIRPRLELLGPEFITKIIDEALLLLEKYGVFVEHREARNLLREKRLKVDEPAQRVYFMPEIVQDSLSSAPPLIRLYDRSGEKEFLIGEDQVHFNPGSAAIAMLDSGSVGQRKPVTGDLVKFVRITDSLEHIHFQSTGLVSGDVPEEMADSYRLFIGLRHSSKPIVTGTFRTEGFKPMYEMLVAVRGSREKLAEKPLAVFDACPSPPLKWSHLTTQSLMDCAAAGIPAEIISMGMTGATSPVTLEGTLVQHVAENLAGLVICQQVRKGAPVIFGGSPSSFDMRKGTTPMGAVETMMIDVAYAQIGKHLKLPTHAYMGLSDAKTNDPQSGLESGIGAVLAALAGINVVSGPGMMNFESTQSLEKLVIDNEICGMAYRLIKGISHYREPMALDLFEPGLKDIPFLTLPHTRKWYRAEHSFPRIIDRDTYEQWVSSGGKSITRRAAEEVERILQEAESKSPDEDVLKELHRIMLHEAEKCGLSSLPESGK